MKNRVKETLGHLKREGVTTLGIFILGALAYQITSRHGVVHLVESWPVAGFALAVVYAWGFRVLPAVALGSFLVQFLFGNFPLLDASILSFAAATQAALGALLIHFGEKRVDKKIILQRAIVWFAVSATLGSLIVPFVEVMILIGNRAGYSELGYLWIHRWSAEAIGCIVSMPLTLLWIERQRRPFGNRLITSGMLGCILVGAVSFFQIWNRSEVSTTEEMFTRRSLSVEHVIRQHWNLSLESIRAISQLFDANKSVDRSEFSRFVRPFLKRHQGVRAYEWIERVPDSRRAEFENKIRRQGSPNFEIRCRDQAISLHRCAKISEYFPVTYIVPIDGNEVAEGYNVMDTLGAATNLSNAVDQGNISLSEPITLIQDTGEMHGVVAYFPVYRGGGKPSSAAERRATLTGVVGGIFRVRDVVEQALGGLDLEGLEVQLSAFSEGKEEIVYSLIHSDELKTDFIRSRFLKIENQTWKLTTALSASALIPNRRPAYWAFPVGGVVSTSIALFLVLLLTGRTADTEALIIKRTSDLRRALQVRDDFLLAASHELKTPLTPMRLQIDLLSELVAEGRIEDFVRGADFAPLVAGLGREVSRYARLVDDLIDFSRISSEKLQLNFQDCDLGLIVRQAKEIFGIKLERIGCTLNFQPLTPIVGYWDPMRIQQVMVNLISNAIKYGSGEPIEIRVEGDFEKSRIILVDHGIGIAEADQDRIFDRFVRAVPIQNYGGLGLGLYIVRELVHAHGGTISVYSVPGHGSTFTVELPNRLRPESHPV